MNGVIDRPVRSQSMGSIPPQGTVSNMAPLVLPDLKESTEKPKVKKKERTHSKTRRKERSRSRSRKSDSFEEAKDEKEKTPAPLVNSETQVITKPVEVTSTAVS